MVPALTCLSSMATRGVLADLTPVYQGRTGRSVALRPMGGVDAARLVRAGEPVDVVVLADGVMRSLEAEGHLVAGSLRPIARSAMAVAATEGAAHPDIRDESGLWMAIRAARRVAYSTGPSGDHLLSLVERAGLSVELAGSLLQAPAGVPVAALLAKGEAELGFQQRSELIGQPGIVILGPLPPGLQLETVFTAGIARSSRDAEAAASLVAFLASSEGEAMKRSRGLEQP
jgi:molybdate transport system substrate-binding protein